MASYSKSGSALASAWATKKMRRLLVQLAWFTKRVLNLMSLRSLYRPQTTQAFLLPRQEVDCWCKGTQRQIFNASNWEFDWPQNEILETLALAQHYGVPTRLLEFTEDPFVAAYFAASEAWDSRNSKVFEDFEKQHLAVWVIDLRFVQCLDNIRGRYPDRIRIIRVPRANNSYLRAQFGFFLVDRCANDMRTRGELLRGEILPEELLSLDRVIADRSSSWQKVHHITCPNQLQTWFGEPPVRRITLHADHTGELLKELSKRGITKATVMPSLDRIVESLAFQMSI